VSDRKRLEAHAAHLAAVVESSVGAIISTTVDAQIVSWNPGAERLYGHREDEVVGRPLELLIPAGQPGELPALRERVIAGERVNHHETVRHRRDGSLVDVCSIVDVPTMRRRSATRRRS
jgi:PAS domain S-box-containing protein